MMRELTAQIHLAGAETADSAVPTSVLIRVLQGLQEAAYVLGAASEGNSVGGRFRPSAELRQRYQLRCGIPVGGSYTLPFSVGGHYAQPPLGGLDMSGQLYMLLDGVSTGSNGTLAELVPDSRMRNLMLRKLETALPRVGERWTLGYSVQGSSEIVLDAHSTRTISRLVQANDGADAVMTVTGELIGIDFSRYQVTLRHPATGRELECIYRQDIEDTLIETRRDYIQVTGLCTVDEEGDPIRLTDVTRIEPVDLSPMTFESVTCNNRTLQLALPLTLVPTLDEDTKQLYVVADAALGLHAYAYTREDLADEVAEQLVYLWQEYGLEDPEALSGEARDLRQALCQRLSEAG